MIFDGNGLNKKLKIRYWPVEICRNTTRRTSIFLYPSTIYSKNCKELLLTTKVEVTDAFFK